MAESVSPISPHIGDGLTSPLSVLTNRALRRYGEWNASTVDAETLSLFIDLANEIIDDVRGHPYWNNFPELEYYVSSEDVRPVPDPVMIAGLLAKFAVNQGSNKWEKYENDYYQRLNQHLYYGATGGSMPLNLQVVRR